MLRLADERPPKGLLLFTAVDWTDEERMIAVAQILRLAGLPDDNCFTAPAAKLKKGRGKTSMVAVLSRRLIDASVLRD